MAEHEEQIVLTLVLKEVPPFSKEQVPSLLLRINSISVRQVMELLNCHYTNMLVYL